MTDTPKSEASPDTTDPTTPRGPFIEEAQAARLGDDIPGWRPPMDGIKISIAVEVGGTTITDNTMFQLPNGEAIPADRVGEAVAKSVGALGAQLGELFQHRIHQVTGE